MNALAADTGGFMPTTPTTSRGGLHEMLKDTETYYVLAYEPTNTQRDGGFRNIEVRLPGPRASRCARARAISPPTTGGKVVASARRRPRTRRARNEQRRAEMTARAPLARAAQRHPRPAVRADFMGLDDGTTQLVVSGNVDVGQAAVRAPQDRRQAHARDRGGGFRRVRATTAQLCRPSAWRWTWADADYERLLKAGLPTSRP